MSAQPHKVSAHLPPELDNKLENWMEEHGHTKYSGAIIAILRHYFNDNIPNEVMPESFHARLDNFEESTLNTQIKVEELEQENIQLKEELESLSSKIEQIKNLLIVSGLGSLTIAPNEIPRGFSAHLEFSKNEVLKGLTKEELCKKLGITIAKCNEYAKNLNLPAEEYIKERTGWIKSGRKYKPNLKWEYYPLMNEEPLEENKLLEEIGWQIDQCSQILDVVEVTIEEYILCRTDWEKNDDNLYELSSNDKSLTESRKNEILQKIKKLELIK